MQGKWRKHIVFFLLLGASMACAQPHYISVGLRGGAGTFLAKGDVKTSWQPNAWVDANYSYLWQVKDYQLGITTGLDFGYLSGAYSASHTDQFTNIDYLGQTIVYTNTVGSVYEHTQGFAMEIPALFALHYKGLIFHVGLKLQVPLWYQYRQTMRDLSISAYYADYDVPVQNELVTGELPQDEFVQTGKRDVADVSLLLSTDIGYEWQVADRDWIALQAWFDGSPYGHTAGNATQHIIDVAPITTTPPAQVTVNTAVGSLTSRLNYLACGIRLAYRFSVPH
ncbi:MAG: hypothetical protein ACI4AI_04300 [Paludibacteraceae bacterium]